MELSSSKKTYLGKDAQGRDRYALDCSLGAVQMRDSPISPWQDIDPTFSEPDTDGFTAKFTRLPSLVRMSNNGARRYYPDRTDLSYWIDLGKPFPTMPAPTKIGHIWTWDWPNATIVVKVNHTSLKFSFTLKNSSAPSTLTLPFSAQGIIRQGNLLLHNGQVVAILRKPIATDANHVERNIAVTFGAGQITLSLDTTGLTYPVEIDPTLDLTTTDADDVVIRNISYWSNTQGYTGVGYEAAGYYAYGSNYRFLSAGIPQGATIDVAYLTFIADRSLSNTVVRTDLCFEDADSPAAITSYADHIGRTRTADIDWDGIAAWTLDSSYNSISVVTPLQAVVNRAGFTNTSNLHAFWEDKDNRSDQASNRLRLTYSYDADSTKATKLHVEYTEGAPPSVRGWTWSK